MPMVNMATPRASSSVLAEPVNVACTFTGKSGLQGEE
jgi:hypothetical protein